MMRIVKSPTERQERVLSELSNLRQSHETGEVPPSWVIVSACTTLESAASEKLQVLLDTRAAQSDDMLMKQMINKQRNDMDRSWPTRLEWLAKGFGVKLAKADKADLLAVVELRNAIAHDSDRFTNRQVNDDYASFLKTRHLLESKFSLHIRGIRFTVTGDTADRVLNLARGIAVDLLA